MKEYFVCPHCGADVPAKALACPNCGSDDETGWSEEAKYVHLLPDRGDDEELPPRRTRTDYRQFVAGALIATILAGIYLSVPGFAATSWGLPTLLLAVVAYAVYYLLNNSPAGKERRQMQALLTRVGGDRELAERLISFERRHNPIADRAELIEAALDRLNSDRR